MTDPNSSRRTSGQSYRPHERLKTKPQFDAVFARKKPVSDNYLIVYGLENDLGHARLGVSVSKRRVSKRAVHRNRIKRLIREAFRKNKERLPRNLDLVVVAKGRSLTYQQVECSLIKLASAAEARLLRDAGRSNRLAKVSSSREQVPMTQTDNPHQPQAIRKTDRERVDRSAQSHRCGQADRNQSCEPQPVTAKTGESAPPSSGLIHGLLSIPRKLVIGSIRIYQWTLSPIIGNSCRFYPTCSHYMLGAIEKYGLARGVWKGLGRVLRCGPWHPGGYDPP